MSGSNGRTWTRADAGKPRRNIIYDWPEEPDREVLFPIRPSDKGPWWASTRVRAAACMKYYHRQLGWMPRVRSTPDGVWFHWEIPE